MEKNFITIVIGDHRDQVIGASNFAQSYQTEVRFLKRRTLLHGAIAKVFK